MGFGLWIGSDCCADAAALPLSAPVLPGPADISRIKPTEQAPVVNLSQEQNFTVTNNTALTQPPEGAKNIHLTLQHLEIEGSTVFSVEQLQYIYRPYIHQNITLDTIYTMADAITKRYRDAGYFLSLAFVPDQQIHDGVVRIKITEGYIAKINVPNDPQNHIIQSYIEDLMAKKPVKSSEVEAFLLRMNDLPGFSFRGILSSLGGTEEGAVQLTLQTSTKEGVGSISFDNYSSRYLGPHEFSASYSASFLPMQQTTLSGLTSVPDSSLYYGTLDHTIVVAPDVTLDINGGVTRAYPGYTLQPYDITSQSVFTGIGGTYQWIRQREQNFSLKLSLDSREVSSDLLGTPLTRDRIRALRSGLNYDVADDWEGHDTAALTVSQGLSVLGASHKNDGDLSRMGALPNFSKAELDLSRLQEITDDWSLLVAASGQMASGTLYSSEEFGYGGQAFGRAYDTSEMTGDQGASGSAEFRYGRWNNLSPVGIQPYVFGDSGVVWNTNKADGERESGTSVGFGMRAATAWQQTGNIGLAWPLTRDAAAPLYGNNPQGPRVLLQISQQF